MKEMEAAELIVEPSDHEEHQVKEDPEAEQQEQLIAVDAEEATHEEGAVEAVEWQEGEAEAQAEGGQVQALFHTIEGEGGEVYLVAENDADAFTGESHSFAVLGDGSHGFQLEDGTIVVQEGSAQGTELSVEQALEAMMGTGAAVGGEDGVAEAEGGDEDGRTVQVQSSAEELQLVLSPAQDDSGAPSGAPMPSMVAKVRTQGDATTGASPSKDIPYAVGLLPLKTALEKIQNIQDYQPRKTRSDVAVKRKASTALDGVDKKSRTDSGGDEDAELKVEQP